MQKTSTSIMIVTPLPLMRIGLRKIVQEHPGWKVTAEAPSAEDAVRAIDLPPSVIIVDISLEGLNGIEPVSLLAKTFSASRTLVLDDRLGNTMSYRVLKLGASGYVRKQSSERDLISAIEGVQKGRLVFENIRDATLTEHETKVLALVAGGAKPKVAGKVLGVSHRTIEAHMSRIRSKIGIFEPALLIRYAIRNKIIKP